MSSQRRNSRAASTPDPVAQVRQPRPVTESLAEIDHQQILRELRQVNEQLVKASVREQELADYARQQAAEWNALVNSLAEGVIVADSDGHLVVANPVARSMLELPAVGLLTKQIEWQKIDFRSLNGQRLPSRDRPLTRAMRGEQFADSELMIIRSDGSRSQFVFSGSAVCDESGQVVLTILTFRDVSELRRLETEREDYVSIISHDLRAPLTIILGRCELLLRSAERNGLDPIAKEAEIILRNARQMNVMIQSLLNTARLESGQIVFKKVPIDLTATIRSTVEAGVAPAEQLRIRI